jgi:hypothetical protein
MLIRFFERALPIIGDRLLDNLVAHRAKPSSRIWSRIHCPRQPQTVKMSLRKDPVPGRSSLDRRDKSPVCIEPDRVRMDSCCAGHVRCAQILHSHLLIQLLLQPIECRRLHLEIEFVSARIELSGVSIIVDNVATLLESIVHSKKARARRSAISGRCS